MTDAQHTEFAIESAVRRGLSYSLLAHCLAYPDGDRVLAMHDAALAATPVLAGGVLAGLVDLAASARQEDIEPQYAKLFSFSSSPDCPSFETAFFSPDPIQQTARMADIAGFYRAFGVDVGGTHLRPDEISVELEFMSYLCKKQVYAHEHLGAPRVRQTVRAQRLFLREHLGQWGSALGQRIALRAERTFYRETGTALAAWIAGDCAAMRAVPFTTVNAPATEWAAARTADTDDDEARMLELDDVVMI